MADAYRLKIDLARIAANLSRAEGKTFTEAEVVEWLESHDFIRQGEWWICEEISLGLLDKSEIFEMKEIY